MQAELTELLRSFKDRFQLEIEGLVSEQEILLMLEKRLGQILERNPEEFFQLLYRIDIPERQLQGVLNDPNALQALARMVYDRQLEKARSRLKYKEASTPRDVDEDLAW